MITLRKLGSIGFLDLTDTPATYFNTEGMFAQSTGSGIIWATSSGGSSDVRSFLELTDTPASYIEKGGKLLSVSNDESGLTFVDYRSINFLELTDTPGTYSGTEGLYAQSTGSGIVWATVSGGGGSSDVQTFLELTDTPNTYSGTEGLYAQSTGSGIVWATVSGGGSGSSDVQSFIDLIDTPTTYSGFEHNYVRVNATGNALEFVPVTTEIQDGVTNIPINASYISITFTNPLLNDNYVLTVSIENKIDIEPSVYPVLIVNKTSSGFTAIFSGEIESSNYYLNWEATGNISALAPVIGVYDVEGIINVLYEAHSVYVTFVDQLPTDEYVLNVSLENKVDISPSVYPILIKDKTIVGFTADFSGEIDSNNYYLNWKATFSSLESFPPNNMDLSDDLSPELSGDLNVGSNLIMLDPDPNGINIHGYGVGYSGEASEMYVSDNPTGFGCPLYMQSNGNWAAACAASGIYNMPCTALALEEDYGEIKKILWKGIIKKGIWNWTPGNKIYVSTVEGALTNIKPNGASWIQVIGMAIAPDTIRFSPDLASENTN